MPNPHFFQKCCHFCWLCFDFSKNDNTFERNEDCATVFLKWTDFSFIWQQKPKSFLTIHSCPIFDLLGQNWPIWRHIFRRDPNKFFCTYFSKLTSVLVHFEVWMLKKRPTLWCCRAALYPCRLFLNVNLLLTSNAWYISLKSLMFKLTGPFNLQQFF